MQCYVCGTENREDAVRCKRCSANLHENTADCPACGQTTEVDGVHCSNCGYDLSQPRINPEERLKALVSGLKYFLAFILALLSFGLTFGAIVTVDLAVYTQENDTIATQDAFNLYQGTYDMLFRSDAFIENRLEGRIMMFGQPADNQEVAELYSTLNLMTMDYLERNGSQMLLVGIALLQSVVLISLQVIPLVVLVLAVVAYIKRKRMPVVKYGFLATALLAGLFSRLQIKQFFSETNLSGNMIGYIVVGLLGFFILVVIEKIEVSDSPEDFFKGVKERKTSMRISAITLGLIILLLLSGAFIRTSMDVVNESTYNAQISTDEINLSPQYLTGDYQSMPAYQYEYTMQLLVRGEDDSVIATQVRGLPYETLFSAQTETTTQPRMMIVATFITSMVIGVVVILNIFVQTINHRLFNNTFAKVLSVLQVLLMAAMVALAILWSMHFNSYLSTENGTISTMIGPSLIAATVLTLVQAVLVFLGNKEQSDPDEVFAD